MNKFPRHQKAIEFALKKIKESPLSKYVVEVVLFGSVARNEERFDSDIDLLLVLNEQARAMKKDISYLKGNISSDEIEDAEADLKITFNKDWRNSMETIFLCIKMDGVDIPF